LAASVSSLRVGGAPVAWAVAPGPAVAGEIVLSGRAGRPLHLTGSINGRSVSFMVDTGATLVAMRQRRRSASAST
jgi:predicted aspartyl protease